MAAWSTSFLGGCSLQYRRQGLRYAVGPSPHRPRRTAKEHASLMWWRDNLGPG
jgi:hypothetical protein